MYLLFRARIDVKLKYNAVFFFLIGRNKHNFRWWHDSPIFMTGSALYTYTTYFLKLISNSTNTASMQCRNILSYIRYFFKTYVICLC